MISLLFIIQASICWAIIDKITHHYNNSIFFHLNPMYWNPAISWINKWKDQTAKEERFWGSSRWFVWTTDGWHLFKSLTILFFISSVIFYKPIFGIYDLILYGVAFNLTFDLFYYRVLVKR